MIRKLRRRLAEIRLALLDAEIAHWYVLDGQLSDSPLRGHVNLTLRERRLEAVRALVRAGGRDPWPAVLREPTEAQRAARGVGSPPAPAKPAEPTYRP